MSCNLTRLDELTSQVQVVGLLPPPLRGSLVEQFTNAFLACNPHLIEAARDDPSSEGLDAVAAPLLERLGTNDANVTAEIRHAIFAKAQGKEGVVDEPRDDQSHIGADPVMLFKGQFVHEVEDISLRGAGIDFVFTRTYKNQAIFNGPLGHNWTHNFHIWLRVASDTIFRTTGDLREEPYVRHPRFGESLNGDFDYWIPPDGKDGVLLAEGSSFALRLPNGVRHVFEPDPAHGFLHRLQTIEDRFSNYLHLRYADDRLSTIEINHPLRVLTFGHDDQGRICSIVDSTQRQWRYTYDSIGDLIAVTSPVTDRYTCGLTVRYDYSSGFQSRDLQHNLIRIIDASGQIYLENEYGDAAGLLSFNRVIRQRQGGGSFLFEYEDIPPVFDRDYPEELRPAHQTILVERNGQPIRHVCNTFGNLLLREQHILEAGLPRALVEQYRYNSDGNVIALLTPEGVLTQHLYGRDRFVRLHGLTPNGGLPTDALTWQERQAFGRVRATVRRDGFAPPPVTQLTQGTWGPFPDIIDGVFPAAMGERARDVITKYTYESTFGQLTTTSDPRFTNSANPDEPNEHSRHTETLTRYLYSAASQFLTEIRRPTPTLPDGTLGDAVTEQFTDYDAHGRLLRSVNPVGTVTKHVYVADTPGDVRSGYLRQTVIDPGGLSIATEYGVDPLGRVIQTTLPRAAEVADDRFRTRTAYNGLDQITELVGSKPFELVTRRFYDRNGKLEREERPIEDEDSVAMLGGTEVGTFCYDEEFHLIRETIGGVDRSSHLITTHRYDGAGRRVATVLPEGNEIHFCHDARFLLFATTRGAGTTDAATTRTEYDGDGRVQRTFDARGNVTTFTRDAFGRVVAEEDALGHIVRRDYDKLGDMSCERAFERQADGYHLLSRREVEYDELGRAVRTEVSRFDQSVGPLQFAQLATAFLADSVPNSVPLIRETFYDAQGRVRRTLDPLSREHVYEYDALDRLLIETDALGNRVVNRYDAHGNVVRRDRIDLARDPATSSVLAERVFSSTFSYDELDRLVSSVDSLGNVIVRRYDSRDNPVRRIDPLGNVVRTDFDLFNRRIAEHRELTTTGLGGGALQGVAVDRFEYDNNTNLVAVVDALGRRTRYRYDALNRRRVIVYPDESKVLLDYDADGNLLRSTDNNGLQRVYSVDALGRAIRVEVDQSTLVGVQVAGAMFEGYSYDGLGRCTLEENDVARREIRLNSLGWPIEETTTFTSASAPLNRPFVIARQYSAVGTLTGLTYPDGRHLRFERDMLDRLIAVENIAKGVGYPGNGATSEVHSIVEIVYVGRQRRSAVYGNGAVITYAHDGGGRVIEITHASPVGPLLRMQHLFDAVGNMRRRQDIPPTGNSGEVFAYDSLYRLVDVTQSALQPFATSPLAPASVVSNPIPPRQPAIDALIGPLEQPSGSRTFQYDLVGNREVERPDAGEVLVYTANELDQYAQRADLTASQITTFAYDANGNLTGDDERRYTYDSLNRLVRVQDGASNALIAEFRHDARGRRVHEVLTGVTTHLICDGDDVIAEYRQGGLFAQYAYDDGIDRPLQIAAEGQEHWYHADLVGSVRDLTDRVGTEAVSYQYTPFGNLTNLEATGPYNPMRFTARRLDEALGQYDFRSRQYDPVVGRFLQRDPARPADRTNLYAYACNGPLQFRDPFGTERMEAAAPGDEVDVLDAGVRDAGPQDAGHFNNPIAGPVSVENPPEWIDYNTPILPGPLGAIGRFAADVVVEGGGSLYNTGKQTLNTLLWGITGSLELINKPISYIEERVCGPGCFLYNPVGATIGAGRAAAAWLSGMRVGKAAKISSTAEDVQSINRLGVTGTRRTLLVRKVIPVGDETITQIRKTGTIGRPGELTYVTLPFDMRDAGGMADVYERLTLASPPFGKQGTAIELWMEVPNRRFRVAEGTQGGLGFTEGGAMEFQIPAQHVSAIRRFRIHSSSGTSGWIEGNPFQ